MKTLALTATAFAFAIALGSASAPAFAADHGNQQNIDTQIVSVSGDTAMLANGFTVDAPYSASAGDKVRVVLTENNDLKNVFVIR